MNNSETNFEDVLKGESKIEIVDKLENLRNQLNSNTLKGRINKKDIDSTDVIPINLKFHSNEKDFLKINFLYVHL